MANSKLGRLALVLSLLPLPALAADPVVPTGIARGASLSVAASCTASIFTADPSAHVFNGKIYVYPFARRADRHSR